MPEPMTPADVPEDYVRAYDDGTAHCWGRPDHGIRLLDCCRREGLAAALTLHEQQIRTAIADRLDGRSARLTAAAERIKDEATALGIHAQADAYANAAGFIRNHDEGVGDDG